MEPLLQDRVRSEWVDYNGHMNDAAYARVFSMAVDALMERLGIDEVFRNQQNYTMFTLETHLCYLHEVLEDAPLQVESQVVDHDAKRLHIIFVMKDGDGRRLATSEQMLMGMNTHIGRPAPFPGMVSERVSKLAEADQGQPIPEEVGRRIGIRKKSK